MISTLRKLDAHGGELARRPGASISGIIVLVGLLCLIFCAGVRAAEPAPVAGAAPAAKVKIVLIGDSTVAREQGWGPGFIKQLRADATCVNWAANGRSSKSFMTEGLWAKALAEKPDYILIQFGHNDMPGKGPERETDPKTTYTEQMGKYVDEARKAGARPILVTSLTRRLFRGDGKIHSNLIEYVEAVKKLAEEKKVPLIDLHARSIELLDKMGPEEAKKFDPAPKADAKDQRSDKTHLTPEASEIFGKIVAEELKKVEPALAGYLK